MSAFAGCVRQALDAGRAGRWLSVRVPLDPATHAASGIDVAALRAAGADIFNLSPWFSTTPRTDGIAHVAQRAPGAATYFELTHCTGNHTHFMPTQLGYGTHVHNPRCADAVLYSAARLALERGATGISLFNFAYYRRSQHWETDTPGTEPPFHVVPLLTDGGFLARQPAQYCLGQTSYFRQVPRMLAPGTLEAFHFEVLPPATRQPNPDAEFAVSQPSGPCGGGRLRAQARRPLTDGGRLQARWNGAPLESCADVGRFFGDPYDPMISPLPHRAAFVVPEALITAGVATVELAWEGAEPLDIIYLDLGIT